MVPRKDQGAAIGLPAFGALRAVGQVVRTGAPASS
jgi:hypothetical protein